MKKKFYQFLIISFYTLFIFEILLRIFLGNNALAQLMEVNNEIVSLKPNASVVHTGLLKKIPPVTQKVNKFGYKGKPRPHQKEKNIYRIIVVGDSFTFCPGLAEGKDYPSRLEYYLCQNGHNVEVLNFGVPSHNLDDLLIHLRTNVLQFNPDLIVIQIAGNDFCPSLSKIFSPFHLHNISFLNKLYTIRLLFTFTLIKLQTPTISDSEKEMLFIKFFEEITSLLNNIKFCFISFDEPYHKIIGSVSQVTHYFQIPYFPFPEQLKSELHFDLGHLSTLGSDLYAKQLTNWILKEFIEKQKPQKSSSHETILPSPLS